MKINYKFSDGTTSTIEVSEEIGNIIVGLDKQERNSYQKLHRRSVSLETYFSDSNDIAANDNFIAELVQKERYENLYQAINQLRPEHRQLIISLYFEQKKMTELAKETNRSVSSISHQRNTALHQLAKILFTNGFSNT